MKLKTRLELEAEEAAKIRQKRRQWDTSKLAIVYIRQSTEIQTRMNRESRGGQSIDLVDMAVREYQWPERNIYPIDENLLDRFGNQLDKPRAASGRLDTSFRSGLRTAEEMIAKNLVGAVFVRDAARLFRDPDQISPPQFAALCKQHHCVVITLDQEYDFNSKYDDYDDFLEECRDAAGYLKTLAKTMHRGKHRKGERGEYAGGAVPVGFMLNEKRSHFVPMPQWCDVVKWLTHRYREVDADLTALHNEIKVRAIFPPLPDDFDISKIGRVQLQQMTKGYTIATRGSLINLLTNPVNIGHAVYRGKIVKYDAHPAIVDKGDFLFAIEHLGSTSLDGEEIQREKRAKRFVRTGIKREGLLSGIRADGSPVLTSSQGSVYIFQPYTGFVAYTIKNYHDLDHSQYVASIAVETVDTALSAVLEEKLRMLVFHAEVERELSGSPEYGAQALLNHVAALRQQVMASLGKIDESCKLIEREIARKQRDYEIAHDVMSTEDIREHYASLARLRSRLDDLRKKQAQVKETDQETLAVSNKLQRARDEWEEMDRDQRRGFIRIITRGISLDALSDKFMKLTVEWSYLLTGEYTVEHIIFLRTNGKARYWTAAELEILRNLYPNKDALLAALPNRTWHAIRLKAGDMDNTSFSPLDYAVMSKYGIAQEQVAEGHTVWHVTEKASINMDGVC